MAIAKRIFLFLVVNILVVTTLTLVLSLLNIKPYLSSYGIDYTSLMAFCLIWGMGGAFISLALSRIMAKWMMGIRIIDQNTRDPQLQSLVNTVHELCQTAGLHHLPEVGIYSSSEPNAFATGPSQKRSLVAVSTGLLQRMSQKELEGVLAHEITHILNGDMVTMTLIQGVVNAFVMFLARAIAFVLSNLGNRSRDSSSTGSYVSYTLFVIVLQFIFMIFGSMVVAWFSRAREFRADKGGALLAGKEKMIAALEALQRTHEVRAPKSQEAFEALQITSSKKGGWMRFFASHPPLMERIEKLKNASF